MTIKAVDSFCIMINDVYTKYIKGRNNKKKTHKHDNSKDDTLKINIKIHITCRKNIIHLFV